MQNQHRLWVANHLTENADQLQYFLVHILHGAAESLRMFAEDMRSETKSTEDQRKPATQAVRFGFYAFSNTVQTLKDSFETATGDGLPWSQIGALRHGQFLKDARNASTHDGHPVVNAWIDGFYLVLLTIARYDKHGNETRIPPSPEDVPTMCLQFAADFSDLLIQRLRPHLGRPELRGSIFTEEQLDEASRSPLVPDFARRLLLQERSKNLAAINGSTHDPIQSAIESLEAVRDFACATLQTQPSPSTHP